MVAERDKLRVEQKPPLLVKIAPDLSDKDKADIAAVVTRKKVGVRTHRDGGGLYMSINRRSSGKESAELALVFLSRQISVSEK